MKLSHETSTKIDSLLNETIALECKYFLFLIEYCKTNLFSISTDGCNDTLLQKMNPVSIHLFYINPSKTVQRKWQI